MKEKVRTMPAIAQIVLPWPAQVFNVEFYAWSAYVCTHFR